MLGKEWRKRSLIAATTIAVGAMVASALPAQAADPGITATTIKLGITLPLTGAASPGLQQDSGRDAGLFQLRQRQRWR